MLGTSEADILRVGTEFLVGLYGGKSRSDLNSFVTNCSPRKSIHHR